MKKLFACVLMMTPLTCLADIDVMSKLYMANNAAPKDDKGNVKPFTMDGELGFIKTTGNTKATSLKAKLDAHQELPQWSNDYVFEGFYKQDQVTSDQQTTTETTAQKVFTSAQGNYKLTNPDYRVFAFASYEDDRFSGYKYQGTLASGWGQQLWKDEGSSFNYSVGPGYSFAEANDGTNANSFILRGALNYQWKVSDNATFRQLISTEIGSDNTKSKSETSLAAKINGSLAMKVSLLLSNNSHVAPGLEKLDTQTAVTLVYTFF